VFQLPLLPPSSPDTHASRTGVGVPVDPVDSQGTAFMRTTASGFPWLPLLPPVLLPVEEDRCWCDRLRGIPARRPGISFTLKLACDAHDGDDGIGVFAAAMASGDGALLYFVQINSAGPCRPGCRRRSRARPCGPSQGERGRRSMRFRPRSTERHGYLLAATVSLRNRGANTEEEVAPESVA